VTMNIPFHAPLLLAATLLGGCFEIPSQEILNTDQGERLIDSCERVPVTKTVGEQKLPSSFEVLVWNIYKIQRPTWQASLEPLLDGSGLLLLQEAVDKPQLTAVLARHHLQWQQITAFRYQGSSAGVLTAAAIPDVYACAFRYPEPGIRIPKSSLISLYPLEESPYPLMVINVHAINFEPGIAGYREQMQRLFGFTRRYPGPVLLAGDLNVWNDKRADVLAQDLRTYRLTAATLQPDERVQVAGQPLDRVYFRGLQLEWGTSTQSRGSDHNPIRLRFHYQP